MTGQEQSKERGPGQGAEEVWGGLAAALGKQGRGGWGLEDRPAPKLSGV